MASIELTIDSSGYTGYLIAIWYKHTAPAAEVGRSVPMAFPVVNQVLLVENLQSGFYRFDIYQSIDGVALNQLLKQPFLKAGRKGKAAVGVFHYTVNGPNSGTAPTWADPASGQASLRDERLKIAGDVKEYTVDEQGRGHLQPGTDYIDRSDAGGGFDLLNDYTFGHGAKYEVTVQYVQETEDEGSGGGGDYMGAVLINEDGAFDPAAHMGKIVLADFATAETGILTFPAFAEIPNGKALFSTRHKSQTGGNQQYFKLQFASGDTVYFHGNPRNYIFIGKAELIELTWISGELHITRDETDYDKLGVRVMGDFAGLNQVVRNGATYTYPQAGRLYDWMVEHLQSGQLMSFAQWDVQEFAPGTTTTIRPYSKFFAFDTALKRLRVPDSRDMVQKAVAEGDTAGDYRHDSYYVRAEIWTGQGDGGSDGTGVIQTGIGYAPAHPATAQFRKKKIEIATLTGGTLDTPQYATKTEQRSELLLPLLYI